MLIDITKIRVFRTNFDVVIGEFVNPITNEAQSVTLGIYALGEKQDFFSANLAEIIDHSNKDNDEYPTSRFNECDEQAYEECNSNGCSGY